MALYLSALRVNRLKKPWTRGLVTQQRQPGKISLMARSRLLLGDLSGYNTSTCRLHYSSMTRALYVRLSSLQPVTLLT